ncbi:hypothetical protein K438DRAFT_1774624 [Mycena galopus ATCC 62051]|nr:hypothetical protein K438DRAFT_1774624 [Mycena galopus ATCC 62051]
MDPGTERMERAHRDCGIWERTREPMERWWQAMARVWERELLERKMLEGPAREMLKRERQEREQQERERLRERLQRQGQLLQMLKAPPEGRLLTLLSSFSQWFCSLRPTKHRSQIGLPLLVFIMLAVLALELIGWFLFLGLLITIPSNIEVGYASKIPHSATRFRGIVGRLFGDRCMGIAPRRW